jgi:hypothetical protein
LGVRTAAAISCTEVRSGVCRRRAMWFSKV